MTVEFLAKMIRPDLLCGIYNDRTKKVECFYRADILASGSAKHSKETVKDWCVSPFGFDILIEGMED